MADMLVDLGVTSESQWQSSLHWLPCMVALGMQVFSLLARLEEEQDEEDEFSSQTRGGRGRR